MTRDVGTLAVFQNKHCRVRRRAIADMKSAIARQKSDQESANLRRGAGGSRTLDGGFAIRCQKTTIRYWKTTYGKTKTPACPPACPKFWKCHLRSPPNRARLRRKNTPPNRPARPRMTTWPTWLIPSLRHGPRCRQSAGWPCKQSWCRCSIKPAATVGRESHRNTPWRVWATRWGRNNPRDKIRSVFFAERF